MAVRPADPRLVADVARRLRGDRDFPFSGRQLWYATCAEMEPAQVTRGLAQIVIGVVFIAGGVVIGILATVFVGALVPVGMVILGMGVQRRRWERSRPTTRALAISYDEFVRETLDPMRARGGDALRGLLDADAEPAEAADSASPGAAPGQAPDAAAPPPLVVCDRAETAALVAAVARRVELACEVVDEQSLAVPPPARVHHALHDADPRACALPLRLAAAGVRQVVDCGLRPGHITGRRIQVIEGAPAVVPADLSGLLSADEVVWLAEGQRVELAVLSPAELAGGLRRVLEAPAVDPPGAAPAAIGLAGASPIPPAAGAAPGGAAATL